MKCLVRLTSSCAALCLVLVAGCSQSTDPRMTLMGPEGTTSALVSAAMGNDLQVADSSSHGGCNSVGFPLRIPSGCPYDAATGWFTCSSTGPGGLTRTLMYQFRDAGGTPQPAYDSLTALIEVKPSVAGTVRRNGHARTVDDHADLTVSGLVGNETTRTWNGAGSSSHSDSSGAGVRSAQSTTTVADVVVPAPFERDSWPLSGSITTHLVTSGGVDLTSVLTFNGTRYATLTVNGMTTTVDLARWLRAGRGARLEGDDDRDDDQGGGDDDGPRGSGGPGRG